jgi:hypothetical protein
MGNEVNFFRIKFSEFEKTSRMVKQFKTPYAEMILFSPLDDIKLT